MTKLKDSLLPISISISFSLFFGFIRISSSAATYDLKFSTYIGGTAWEMARDVCGDRHGNVYITGGTKSVNYPITGGVCDTVNEMNGPNTGSDGSIDVLISKFDSTGQLIWSTFLGGPNYDRAYGIEVDSQGYVYVAGRAGPNFPVKNAFQPSFQGANQGRYGDQNAFVAKLMPDASDVVWASYVGTGYMTRDLAIDDSGHVYVLIEYLTGVSPSLPPASWFTNAYQKTVKGGCEFGVVKIKPDGSDVAWATWLGGSDDENAHGSVRVDKQGFVYVAFTTLSTDMPKMPGVFDTTFNGGEDYYVAKLSPDGSNLIYGTYVGDSTQNWYSTHNFAIDTHGNAYVAFLGSSAFPVTQSPFHTGGGGGGYEVVVTKLSPTGALLNSTWIGGSQDENADGIYVDEAGNIFISGETGSNDMPVTDSTAYQPSFGGNVDAFCIHLSADFTTLLYCTYMGGGAYDAGRSGFMDIKGRAFYLTGSTDGGGWPVKDAYQDTFAGGSIGWGAGDCILTKFNIIGTVDIQSDNHPTKENCNLLQVRFCPFHNAIILSLPDVKSPATVRIYTMYGRMVKQCYDIKTETSILDVRELAGGMYVIKVEAGDKRYNTKFFYYK